MQLSTPPVMHTPSLLRPYAALAALMVVTLGAGVLLTSWMTTMQERSVRDALEWTERGAHFGKLAAAAAGVNRPGHDVIRSGDIDAEAARLETAVRAFDIKFDSVRAIFRQQFGTDDGR